MIVVTWPNGSETVIENGERLWVGRAHVLVFDSAVHFVGRYPVQGCSFSFRPKPARITVELDASEAERAAAAVHAALEELRGAHPAHASDEAERRAVDALAGAYDCNPGVED